LTHQFVDDCRCIEQDNTNFGHVLAFISRYEHLNNICFLLKSNETRLNIYFKYGIKEVLKYLHINAEDNIMFVFTNARANFFMPGTTSNQLEILVNELEDNAHLHVPYSKENTFFF